MARSSTPQGSLRQRGTASKKVSDDTFNPETELDKLAKAGAQRAGKGEVEYKIGLAIITILAFVTRFWGISHPNEVVFDEVHFGKVTWHHYLSADSQWLTNRLAVCFLLPRANLLLRCPPSLRKASLRLYGLAGRL